MFDIRQRKSQHMSSFIAAFYISLTIFFQFKFSWIESSSKQKFHLLPGTATIFSLTRFQEKWTIILA